MLVRGVGLLSGATSRASHTMSVRADRVRRCYVRRGHRNQLPVAATPRPPATRIALTPMRTSGSAIRS
jgi:hypothetical protein